MLRLPCGIGADVYFIPSKTNYKLNILQGHPESNNVKKWKVYTFRFFIFVSFFIYSTIFFMSHKIKGGTGLGGKKSGKRKAKSKMDRRKWIRSL